MLGVFARQSRILVFPQESLELWKRVGKAVLKMAGKNGNGRCGTDLFDPTLSEASRRCPS